MKSLTDKLNDVVEKINQLEDAHTKFIRAEDDLIKCSRKHIKESVEFGHPRGWYEQARCELQRKLYTATLETKLDEITKER